LHIVFMSDAKNAHARRLDDEIKHFVQAMTTLSA